MWREGSQLTMVDMSELLLLTTHDTTDHVEVRRARWRDRVVARLRAGWLDRELAAGVAPETDAALALRAQRLIGPGPRRALGRQVERLVRDAHSVGHWVVAPIPPRRREVLDASDDLNALADRLLAPDPVAVRGVAQVRVLLSDGSGPLYFFGASERLRSAVRRALRSLEPALAP
jgi:hypothetical protein